MNFSKINFLTLGIAVFLMMSFQIGLAQEKEAPKQVLITNVKVWDGTSDSGSVMAAGVYFCRVDVSGAIDARKMLLVK